MVRDGAGVMTGVHDPKWQEKGIPPSPHPRAGAGADATARPLPHFANNTLDNEENVAYKTPNNKGILHIHTVRTLCI